MTAQELFEYSHEPYRTELLAGRLVEMEPAGALHGAAAARICQIMANHVRAHELGEVFGAETGYHLESDPDTVRAPDASFVSRARIEALGGIPNEFWPGPPDVAFEVTSPRDRRGEVAEQDPVVAASRDARRRRSRSRAGARPRSIGPARPPIALGADDPHRPRRRAAGLRSDRARAPALTYGFSMSSIR